MQHGEVMKAKQIIKSISFSQKKECERLIIEHVKKFDIDFAKETKDMWMNRLNIKDKSRLSILVERLENPNICREQKWKIQNEIKQIEESMNES